MKKLITFRKNKPTLINLDATCGRKERDVIKELREIESMDLAEKLFSIFLMQYLQNKAEEVHCIPKANQNYRMFNLMKDGSKTGLISPPPFVHRQLLQKFNEQKIIDYNPYSDEEQHGLIDVLYKGKTHQLELCVQQSRYGREIILKKPDKKTK